MGSRSSESTSQCRAIRAALAPKLTNHHRCSFIWISRQQRRLPSTGLFLFIFYFPSTSCLHFESYHNGHSYPKGSILLTLHCLPRTGQVWVLAFLVLQKTICEPSLFSLLATIASCGLNILINPSQCRIPSSLKPYMSPNGRHRKAYIFNMSYVTQ